MLQLIDAQNQSSAGSAVQVSKEGRRRITEALEQSLSPTTRTLPISVCSDDYCGRLSTDRSRDFLFFSALRSRAMTFCMTRSNLSDGVSAPFVILEFAAIDESPMLNSAVDFENCPLAPIL